LREIPVDRDALDAARDQLCYNCGSPKVVSSFSRYPPLAKEVVRGWLCKKCLSEWEDEEMWTGHGITMFGDEGFLDDDTTVYELGR
jgi:hypothetical protein